MLTTGFKLFFGFCLAAVAGAVTFGYTTGGEHVGPLTLGYKGGIGNHTGYTILIALGFVSGALAVMLVAFRDADPRAAAELVGTDYVPAQKPVGASYWPMIGAFGAGTALVGLVLHPAIFVLGLLIAFAALVEWMMQAWADRATGDPEVNRRLRDRIMQPIEIPVGAALAIVLVPLGISRVLLAASEHGAVIIGVGVLLTIITVSSLLALRPKLSKNLVAAVVLIGGIALVSAAITSAAIGPREVEKHTNEQHTEGSTSGSTGTGATGSGATGSGTSGTGSGY
jgi:hypothetical protein